MHGKRARGAPTRRLPEQAARISPAAAAADIMFSVPHRVKPASPARACAIQGAQKYSSLSRRELFTRYVHFVPFVRVSIYCARSPESPELRVIRLSERSALVPVPRFEQHRADRFGRRGQRPVTVCFAGLVRCSVNAAYLACRRLAGSPGARPADTGAVVSGGQGY